MVPKRPNPTLTEDLIEQILIRVPVKSLLCFQLVSKTWLSLIKDPAFVKSQLLHALKTVTHETETFILYRYIYGSQKFSLLSGNSCQIMDDIPGPCPRDTCIVALDVKIVGSANGIVCVSARAVFEQEHSIYLWNPATRQSKVIQGYSVPCGYNDVALGFGYDKIDEDFKVFKVIKFESTIFSAEVYSENGKAWRNVHEPIDIPHGKCFDVCVDGFLCGIGDLGMMAIDLNKDVLNCAIKLPFVSDDDENVARIIEFNKFVAVILSVTKFNGRWTVDEKISLWMLNDDACLRGRGGGVEASWTPIFSIDVVVRPPPHTGFPMPINIHILGCIVNENISLLTVTQYEDYAWISCNANKKEAKTVPLSVDMADHEYSRHVYKYTESLVSLAGFKQVTWNASEDDDYRNISESPPFSG